MKNKLTKITEREKDVMAVLWKSESSLTSSAIAEKGGGLSINTVQAVMRSLLKKDYIEIAEIVYSGTVLTRSYKAKVSAEEFAADQLKHMIGNTFNFSTLNFINYLKKEDATIIAELEEVITHEREKEEE